MQYFAVVTKKSHTWIHCAIMSVALETSGFCVCEYLREESFMIMVMTKTQCEHCRSPTDLP